MMKILVVVGIALLVGSFLVDGVSGLLGMFLGLSTAGFGAYALYAVIKLLRDAAGQTRTGTALVIIAFIAKFPVIGLGAYLSYRLGTMSLACFVAGVLVVYFSLVWRAARHGLYPH